MVAPKREINEIADEEDIVGTLEEVVARIQARGEGFVLPRPPQDAVDRVVARAMAAPSFSREEEKAWNEAWLGILNEAHKGDLEDDIAEGRG